MSTDVSTSSEWADFSQFVETKLGHDLEGKSLEDSVAEFRAYQRDLEALQTKIQHSIDQADRGEVHPLDDDAFWAKANRRFDELGIPE
jgi:hypothetical protein